MHSLLYIEIRKLNIFFTSHRYRSVNLNLKHRKRNNKSYNPPLKCKNRSDGERRSNLLSICVTLNYSKPQAEIIYKAVNVPHNMLNSRQVTSAQLLFQVLTTFLFGTAQ